MEIQRANPPGTITVHRIEILGRDPYLQHNHFLTDDAGSTEMNAWSENLDGTPLGAPKRSTATWEDLRLHAAFPATATTRGDEACTTEAGEFDCWKYTIQRTDDSGPAAVDHFWFAKDRPGPPVLYQSEVNGQVMLKMTFVGMESAAE